MPDTTHYDAVVIGAGFAGMYMLKKLRDDLGMNIQVYERGSGVGGTWFWNRYPGARCDSESYIYCFSFDDDLLQEWNWSGKYPEQPEILEYLNHVADRFDLRSGIQFNTSVTAAHFNDDSQLWEIETDQGDRVTANYVVTAIGCISTGQIPQIPGLDSFQGDWHHTGAWPHDGVDFEGKRVAVIGTGSSGVQSIPVIARESKHLTVFQRTPQYTIPARHENVDQAFLKEVKANYTEIMQQSKVSFAGFPVEFSEESALEVSDEERRAKFEELWELGGFRFLFQSYGDIAVDRRANDTASEFIRSKIREIVNDPATAEKLLPRDHPFGSKRALIDTNYFDTYNRDNVDLVDIRHFPIEEITPTGLRTADGRRVRVRRHRLRHRLRRNDRHLLQHRLHRPQWRRTQGEVERGTEDLPRPLHDRLPQHVHDHRPRFALGAEQHAGLDRTARGIRRRLHRVPARARRRHG